MKYFALIILIGITLQGCDKTRGHSVQSLKDWPNSHWKSQNYEPLIKRQDEILVNAINPEHSMFADVDSLSPEDFLDNLKKARIIKGVYNTRSGFFRQTVSSDVEIILNHNFYALSYDDQIVIAQLLSRSFNQETYLLRDASTKNIVGQIVNEKLSLF